jgi:hypothetical protein
MIENYDIFSKWNGNFCKICDILGKLYVFFNNMLQKISSKNCFIWKSEKDF